MRNCPWSHLLIMVFFLNLAYVACSKAQTEKMLESKADLTLFEITSVVIVKSPEYGTKQLM